LGTVEAPDEKGAIAEAMRTFYITPARRFRLLVRKIDELNKKDLTGVDRAGIP
jgi:hypothetical protein